MFTADVTTGASALIAQAVIHYSLAVIKILLTMMPCRISLSIFSSYYNTFIDVFEGYLWGDVFVHQSAHETVLGYGMSRNWI